MVIANQRAMFQSNSLLQLKLGLHFRQHLRMELIRSKAVAEPFKKYKEK